MNTNNIKPYEYNKETCFEEIFEKTYPLFVKYMKQEHRFNWAKDEFDINIADDQMLLKMFLQINFVEELNEATMGIDDRNHFVEEIVDAFNFLLASYFIYGLNYNDLEPWVDDEPEQSMGVYRLKNKHDFLYSEFYRVVEQVGRACNLLKNYRTWKSCQYRTDLYMFNKEFKKIWVCFNKLCNVCGISSKELFEIWSCKYQINIFRIESNY